MKAKTWSLISKIVAGAIAIGGHILMWVGILPNARSAEILALAGVIATLFVTVDANIAFDKFATVNTQGEGGDNGR